MVREENEEMTKTSNCVYTATHDGTNDESMQLQKQYETATSLVFM